jgi:hypothetical protein
VAASPDSPAGQQKVTLDNAINDGVPDRLSKHHLPNPEVVGRADSRSKVTYRKEKRLFEFDVVVSDGSSIYDVDLTEIITRLGGEIVAKMSPELIALGVVGIALILAARSVWCAHIQARVERRREEIALEEKKAFLATQRFMSEEETRRLELLSRAKQAMPVLSDIDELAVDGRQALLKGLSVNGGGEVQDIPLSSELTTELTRSARQASREEAIHGVYDVLLVDTRFSEGFRVRLQDIGTGEEFFATLQDRLVSEEHYRAVQSAEWNKVPVRLTMRARRLRGKIVEAVILDAVTAGVT